MYVRRAAGRMKGADSGSRPAPNPLPAPGSRPQRALQPGPSLGSLVGTTPGRGGQGAEPGRGGPADGGAGRRGAGGGDVATAQAGGARPWWEAEPPGEEAPSGPGAAAGGCGNAGSGACPGERPARGRRGWASARAGGRRAVRAAGAGPRVGGRRVAQSGPQPRALRPVSPPVWVPVPPPACPSRAQGGEVSGALPAGP